MKVFKIIFINVLIFILVIVMTEISILSYRVFVKKEYNTKNYILGNYSMYDNYRFDGSSGRLPDIKNVNLNNPPILIFGCSFAYGQYLKRNQIFSYKLSQALNRPVYNRARAGMGLNFMYYQTTKDSFYNEVPKPDTVIYIMIDDIFRRMYTSMFKLNDIECVLKYKKKNGEFKSLNTRVNNAIRNTLLRKTINIKFINKFVDNPSNADTVTNEALDYFIFTRKNLEEHYNSKIRFIVYLYEPIGYQKEFTDKLIKNGFEVITYNQITGENLNLPYYKMVNNGHPKETAWNLIVPKFIEVAKLKKY